MLKVEIDYESCMRTGQCYRRYARAFRARDDDFPEGTVPEFGEDLRDEVEAAATNCPSASITVVESAAD
jgi:ferredoxin